MWRQQCCDGLIFGAFFPILRRKGQKINARQIQHETHCAFSLWACNLWDWGCNTERTASEEIGEKVSIFHLVPGFFAYLEINSSALEEKWLFKKIKRKKREFHFHSRGLTERNSTLKCYFNKCCPGRILLSSHGCLSSLLLGLEKKSSAIFTFQDSYIS